VAVAPETGIVTSNYKSEIIPFPVLFLELNMNSQIHAPADLTLVNRSRYPMNRSLVGSRSRFECPG
jgi:hypothetical protein